MKYFLGLDLSLTGTGYAILDEQASVVKIGTICVKNTGSARLNAIENEVLNVVVNDGIIGNISLALIEGYAFGAFSGRERLGELGGVIRLLLYRARINYGEVPPMTLKKYITGSGKGDKNLMLKAIYKKWGMDCADDNQADAYALARMAHAHNMQLPALTYETECLNVVFNPKVKKKRKTRPETEVSR